MSQCGDDQNVAHLFRKKRENSEEEAGTSEVTITIGKLSEIRLSDETLNAVSALKRDEKLYSEMMSIISSHWKTAEEDLIRKISKPCAAGITTELKPSYRLSPDQSRCLTYFRSGVVT